MCLERPLGDQSKWKKSGKGWKVLSFTLGERRGEKLYNTPVFAFSSTMVPGVWYTRQRPADMIQFGAITNWYLSGFHIFKRRKDAQDYMLGMSEFVGKEVVKVRYRKAGTYGTQTVTNPDTQRDRQAPTVVADEMMIEGESNA